MEGAEVEKEKERERVLVWGEGGFCKENETTTDRDLYVITGHHAKNPQHKVTKKVLSFHFSIFFCINKEMKK